MKGLVVGGGSIGTRHLRNLQALGLNDLTFVEVLDEQRRKLEAECDVRGFDSLQTGLDWRPDFVVIATPTELHATQALEAAKHGCHLFIEKPLAPNLQDADELASETQARTLVTLVGCNMRFHPGPAQVKQVLASGAIGAVLSARLKTGSFLPRWRPSQDYRKSYSSSTESGGVILDGIHELDLALWYLGGARVIAAAHQPAHSLGLETDGTAEILLCHNSGALCNVHLNFVQRNYHRSCEIVGTEGTVDWDWTTGIVRVFGSDGVLCKTYKQPDGWQANQMYLDEMYHFLECVERGEQTINPLAGGVDALRIALAVRAMGAGQCL